MSSRQDQLHSYQFMVQRVVAALVMRESDPAQSPFRRAAGASLASVLIAVIALGGFAGYGVLTGGGAADWRDPTAVIVERETGARYVWLDEKLHPVANYASALLITGAADPRTVLVSRASIDGVPRGAPLGIPDAPDSLPDRDRLVGAPWMICSTPSDGGQSAARSAVLVGVTAEGGAPLTDDALLGRHPNGEIYLIWHNHRYRLRDQELVLTALGWSSERSVPVSPALLNALPAGADLAPLRIAGRGQRSAGVGGARVGQVFAVSSLNGERQYAVAMPDGLAAITEVQAALLLAVPGQDAPIELPQGRFTSLPRVADLVPTGASAPPATTPELAAAENGVVCGEVRDDRGVSQVRVGAVLPGVVPVALPEDPPNPDAGLPRVLADHVIVPPGRAAVVEAVAAPGATGGTICVVTDLGRRYPVIHDDVLSVLGYGGVKPLRVPAGVVTLVPAGPALDPATARIPPVSVS